MSPLERLRIRLLNAVLDPFSHGTNPLENTLTFDGDSGLFGPGSVTWLVMGDIAALFGGVRALLIQFAHPEVAAGMVDHSSYERDHLGRISRTTDYISATTFGAMPEVERAVEAVRRAHRVVTGTSHRDRSYTADDADLSSWVHNALSESFLTTYQHFGPRPLTASQADEYALEQMALGNVIGATELHDTSAALSSWIGFHAAVSPSPGAQQMVPFIASPPSGRTLRLGYKLLFWAVSATIPKRIRRALGVRKYPGALALGRILSRILRWAMGSSPTWHAALIRCEASPPHDVVFRQPLPGHPPDK